MEENVNELPDPHDDQRSEDRQPFQLAHSHGLVTAIAPILPHFAGSGNPVAASRVAMP